MLAKLCLQPKGGNRVGKKLRDCEPVDRSLNSTHVHVRSTQYCRRTDDYKHLHLQAKCLAWSPVSPDSADYYADL